MKNWCNLVKKWHTKIFSIIDPVFHCYNGAIGPKMRFGCNFWLEGPFDLIPMRLKCILQDLFRKTPLDHIWRAIICHIWPNMHCWVGSHKKRFVNLKASARGGARQRTHHNQSRGASDDCINRVWDFSLPEGWPKRRFH